MGRGNGRAVRGARDDQEARQGRLPMELDSGEPEDEGAELAAFRFDPISYVTRELGWEPWRGSEAQPGQCEVMEAYRLALIQQHEKSEWEAGRLSEAELRHWRPGEVIRNRIRVEAGHTVGKTKLASGLVSHFFDCFIPSIIYTFAPTWEQIHDLLWKEIKADRFGKELPGRLLDLSLERGPDHFAKGRATHNAHGMGTERVQGQHGRYLMFVLDEAEGIPGFVWDAVDSMTSGGTSVVLMLANPRTRLSRFHKAATLSNARNFRISCLWHPNVLAGREIVPGAVRREYVDHMIEKHCEIVNEHDERAYTFELPWAPGALYRPNAEFLFRVLGVAPANVADNTIVPVGLYHSARERAAPAHPGNVARMGVDVARFGKDSGTLYIRHAGRIWRAREWYHKGTLDYAQAIRDEAIALHERGVTSLHIRVDAGGGFGGGVMDLLEVDETLTSRFSDFQVVGVHFGGQPWDTQSHADMATELYARAAEALGALRVESPPDRLEEDLCERAYNWVTRHGIAVRRLEPKDEFRRRFRRSPDDGDGFVLAAAPDYLFRPQLEEQLIVYDERVWVSPF